MASATSSVTAFVVAALCWEVAAFSLIVETIAPATAAEAES